jgi:uncharacterized protein YdiU (UPF0061 family)
LQFDLERLRESLGYLITADTQISAEDKSKLIQEMAQSFALLRKQADVDLELALLKKLALSQLENYNVVSLLLSIMYDSRADFTATFRQLSEVILNFHKFVCEIKIFLHVFSTIGVN